MQKPLHDYVVLDFEVLKQEILIPVMSTRFIYLKNLYWIERLLEKQILSIKKVQSEEFKKKSVCVELSINESKS